MKLKLILNKKLNINLLLKQMYFIGNEYTNIREDISDHNSLKIIENE